MPKNIERARVGERERLHLQQAFDALVTVVTEGNGNNDIEMAMRYLAKASEVKS